MVIGCSQFCFIKLLTIILVVRSHVEAHYTCWTPPIKPLTHSNEPSIATAVKSALSSFRITPIYTRTLEALPNSQEVKKRIVEYALEYWNSTLKPKSPLSGPFRVSRGCVNNEYVLQRDSDGQLYEYCLKGCNSAPSCYTAGVPKQYLDKCRVMKDGKPTIVEDVGGPGLPDTDYALIVDATLDPVCEEGVLAFATICQADMTLDRPIFGYVNICPNYISMEYPLLFIMQRTVQHEIAHALGFSPQMYAFMRNENGDPRTPRDNQTGNPNLGQLKSGFFIPSDNTIGYAIREWKSVGGTFRMNRTLLKTPNIVAFAKSHFGCDTLDGVELENQGGDGTASAHFEKRIALNDLMVGSVGGELVVSKLTLSFFLDSGWYHVDMSKAQTYLWAQNAGCNFIFQSCYEYMQGKQAAKQSVWPWCNEIGSGKTQCSTHENAYGTCNLEKLRGKLGIQYQYFDAIPGVSKEMLAYYGGADGLTDYCPYVEARVPERKEPSSYCGHVENEQYADKRVNLQLQNYGADAMCFTHDSSMAWKSYQCNLQYEFANMSASCHRFKCIDAQGLAIVLAQKEYLCPLDGGSIEVNTVGTSAYIQGKIICPKCSTICKNCPSKGPSQTTIPDGYPDKIPCPDAGLMHRQSKIVLILVGLLTLNSAQLVA